MHRIELFVLDMDGTVYLGDQLLPGALDFFLAVKESGARYLFLTNNSSKTADQYVEKLRRLGVPVEDDGVLTSGDATAELLKQEGRYHRLYMAATPSVEKVFTDAGFQLTTADPEAVVLTYDTTLTYEKLQTVCLLLRKGLPYIATHPDFNCPDPRGPLPDIGAFMACIEASTQRQPDLIVGKPNPGILQGAMLRAGTTPQQTMMIGDRLYTDIACAKNAGATGALVLTGETTREMVPGADHQPDLIVESLLDLARAAGIAP